MSTVGLSERDNKETLFVKEEVTNDAEVFGEVEVDVEGSQTEPLLSMLPPPGSSVEREGPSLVLGSFVKALTMNECEE